jgi:hypothetical protein
MALMSWLDWMMMTIATIRMRVQPLEMVATDLADIVRHCILAIGMPL